jgi:bifunctional N-acetylglucosamine-1-phosphate-uridyltransferase/glucosamine-1-phosphate-acetyltransferase GlmU-like protein
LPPKPKIPPYVTALEALETLRLKKLWQADKVKEYYSELTDIVRQYIEAQFGVQAVEMTTDDILYGLKNIGINAQAMGKLTNTLQTADLVKFAKATPHALENDTALSYSVDFVSETKTQHKEKTLLPNNNNEPQNTTS